LNPAEVTW